MMASRLCILALVALALFAQDYRAKIQGIVTDSSDASVAGAKVTIRNINTGVAATKDTGPNGAYLFDNVEPGTYVASAEFQGFSRQQHDGVLVQTRADVTVNFNLKPGALVETVTVSGQAVNLQFNTTTRELTVDRKMLMDLPVKARNPFTLALLDPAVVSRYTSEKNPFFMWSSSQMDVGGNTSTKNDLLLDGAPIQIGPKGSYAPPMDAVQEFSVQQNSVDAEFGHLAGGTMSVSTKSETNDIHGTAYYFGRNPKLNAVVNPITRTPNFVRNHIWGGTAGGPILKNRLFTFFTYEGWRTKEPRDAIRTMPTDLERTGDFSRSLTRSGALRTIYDPTTTVLNVASNTASREPFAGNIIPASRIDATARRIMQDIWGPNNGGDDLSGSNNFKASYPWPMKDANFSDRTDWNISDKLKVFGRYSQFRTTLDQGNYTPNKSRAMPNDNGGIMNSRNIAGDVVYTLSARTVLNFRASYAMLEDDYSAPEYAVGEKGLAEFWPNNPWYAPYVKDMPLVYYPNVVINGQSAASYGKGSYWFQHPHHYSLSGKASQQRGSHYLKAGAEYRYHVGIGIFPNLMNLNFYPDSTANTYLSPNTTLSGDAHASFLLGVLDNRTTARGFPFQTMRVPFLGSFIHDDWKISRRLTLNLGLRHEWESGPYDDHDIFSRYLDLSAPNQAMLKAPPVIPADILALSKPTFNGAWVFTDGSNRKAWTTQTHIFLPRVGLAVRVNDKTALNIGFARYVVPVVAGNGSSGSANTLAACTWCTGFSQTSNPLPNVEGRPQAYLSNPFPASSNPLQLPIGKSLGPYTNVGNGANWPDQDYRAQTNDRINFTIMREMPGNFKLDATWFMNIGRHVPHDQQMNMADPNLSYLYKAQLSQNISNPFYNYLTPDVFPGSLRNPATVTRGSLLRPYPQYGGNLTINGYGNWRARYEALQLRVQRTYAAGASVLFAYNYNQERNEAYFNDLQQYVNQVFWLGSNNARHRATIAGTYDFPVGKGRKFGSSMHPVINAAIGGWQISGIYTYRSGEFLRFPAADVSGEPYIDNPGPAKWFNTEAYKVQTPFTPRLNPYQYPGITGPIFWNADGTISKTFPIRERYKLEFRFEAYNLTNSLMWANPNNVVGNPLFGRSTTQATGNRGREMQYTLRLQF
ncbi:MAG TPA: carboxypeptidase-like regulatory domain-containing protein [Bryobacteraceae bacterium]|nr:carboxypeptidase-like regulatory domain-containing protein [Bryobacteraceae bacterium]